MASRRDFDEHRFTELVGSRGLVLGRPLTLSPTTGSTSDDAMAAARAGAPHGALFVALEQTGGRGRRGRTWTSPPGANLMFSVVLRPKLPPERMQTLTLAFGLATRDVLGTRVDVPVLVKWPNDVMARGKKLAGLLLESQLRRGQITSIVAGIGVNVQARSLPPELSEVATSLALLGASELALEPLLVDLLAELEARLAAHESSGLQVMLDELRAHDALRGRRVRIEGVSGTATGIAEDGALVVEDGEGRRCAIKSGSVELL